MTQPTTNAPAPRRRRLRAVGTLLASVGLALTLAGTAVAAPVGAAARVVTVDGKTFRLRMVASGLDLPSSGGTVHVSGSGYNPAQPVTVSLCAIPEGVTVGDTSTYTQQPTPCLGGAGAITEADDGAFAADLVVKPAIQSGAVCGVSVRCAIVTKSTNTTQRTYDQYIKVNFG
ncbi:hypothetical protein ABZX85_44755 [Streptomyces sp. NPDC004539]|uniref:hypothetical protein n=1 Tax=Streptomyces sp. NPDC004539 TaxID=3154280 RepID=UPI0033B46D2A